MPKHYNIFLNCFFFTVSSQPDVYKEIEKSRKLTKFKSMQLNSKYKIKGRIRKRYVSFLDFNNLSEYY